MSSQITYKGREGFADRTVDIAGQTQKAMLLDLDVASTYNKLITGATNASPIVITSNTHGFANGDIVIIRGAGGNTAANNTWVIQNVATNTFELQGSTGNGAFTSGGSALDLTLITASTGISGSRTSGTTDATLAGGATTGGIIDFSDPTWAAVPANAKIHAVAFYQSTGTDRVYFIYDGKQRVEVAATANVAATSITVEDLQAEIPNGTVLVFSNGASATLTATGTTGSRTLTVSALAAQVTASSFCDAPACQTGQAAAVPVTIGSSATNYTFTIDNGTNKLFKL